MGIVHWEALPRLTQRIVAKGSGFGWVNLLTEGLQFFFRKKLLEYGSSRVGSSPC
jgi:hypothetical protein